MTSANQRKTTFISQKLQFLKDQGEQLKCAVGLYVNSIVQIGESWTEGGDNKLRFLELCQMIDSAVESLCEKCGAVSVDANHLSLPSDEQSNLTSQSTAVLASTTSVTQHEESAQPAEETQLKPLVARIAALEKTVGSFQSNAEKVAEHQSGVDQQLKELFSKLSESEKKQNSRLRKVKEQISEINTTQVALDQEHERRLQNLEEQLHKLSTEQDRMKVEMESQAELTKKQIHVPDQLESVKENFDLLDFRVRRIMDDCSDKHQDIELATRDLADKIRASTDALNVIPEGQLQVATLLGELEKRLQTLEADTGRKVTDIQEKAEKGEANFRVLCQMINGRVTPLEHLRTCLNRQASIRGDNVKQLTQVIQQIAAISPRLQQLELTVSRTRCGFTAVTSVTAHVTGDVVRPYTVQHSNVGGHFNADSGVFTAPVDGLYVTSLSLYLFENNELEVGVRHEQRGLGESSSTFVCISSAEVKGTNACSVGVVEMKAGDTLFSYVYQNNKTVYDKIVCFSCFLLV